MQVVIVDDVLKRAREVGEKKAIEKAKASEAKRWERLAPLFSDYLNGMTIDDVCRKYGWGARTELYAYLAEYEIPKTARSTSEAHQVRKIVKQALARDARLKALKACPCFTCQWIAKRVELVRKGVVNIER